MSTPVYHIDTISELHQLNKMEMPLHPLLSVHRIEDLPVYAEDLYTDFSLGFYTIGFKQNVRNNLKYGKGQYDFQGGVLTFTAPNQLMSLIDTGKEQNEKGWLLLFSAELLASHPILEKLKKYHFFDYKLNEALHLSPAEEDIMNDLFSNIELEYRSIIDTESKNILLSNLDLLLSYSSRFYKRQFVLRNDIESSFLERFESKLNDYFNSESLQVQGIPSVSHFASQMNISSNYLSDMLRTLTGKSTLQHIHLKIVEQAKLSLLGSELNITEIAYDLGFEDAAYFSRFFKAKIGMSPTDFRLHQN